MLPSIPTRWRFLAVAWAALSLLVSISTALQVAPGSPCASVCMDRPGGDAHDPNSSTTSGSEIVCEDPDFTSTVKGLKFKDCTECLQASRYVSGSESDVYWYLYNLRYAASVCLFNYPVAVQNKSFACLIPQNCGALESALKAGYLMPDNGTQLDYCTADDSKMQRGPSDWGPKVQCPQCLATAPDMWFLSNFMVALDAGCRQKPKPGDLIGLSGSLFTRYAVNITDPPQLETGPPPPAQTNMSMGTIIGIAIGAALLLLGGVALFVVYWRKQRRLNAEDARRNADSPNGGSSITALALNGGGPGSSGPGSGGLRGGYTLDHKKEYSLHSLDPHDPSSGRGVYGSSGDYYDQMEKHQQVAQKFGVYPAANAGVAAMPTHPAYIPRAAIVSQTQQRHSTDSRGSRGTSASQQLYTYQHSPQTSPLQQQLQQQQQQTRAPGISSRSTPRATPEPIVLAPPPASKSRYAKTSPSSGSGSGATAPSGTESYALQQYLAGSDDRPVPPPPAGPPPSQQQRQQQRQQPRALDPDNIPPPPPPQPKVPSLVLPSVPKIRVPKKYYPPKISVQEATPIDGPDSAAISAGLGTPSEVESVITGPLDHNFTGGSSGRRSQERERAGSRASPRPSYESARNQLPLQHQHQQSGPSRDRIVRQTIEATRRLDEVPIASGKSRLYG